MSIHFASQVLVGDHEMQDSTQAKGAPQLQRALLNSRRVHVLVVDDYPDNVNSLAILLRFYGHKVDTALSGRAAIDQARTNKPDVVLLDISMPEMDGYEVARQLRALFQDGITLIALTANGSEDDRRKATVAGFNLHLIKPTDPEKLELLLLEFGRSL
jgi:CheY-like chemotaxis protein